MSISGRVEAIRWFSSVGSRLPESLNAANVRARSWKEAVELCDSDCWEGTVTEAHNELTEHLDRVCRSEFQQWNVHIGEVKAHFEQSAWETMENYVATLALPDVVVDCVKWDTMHAVMVERYEKWSPPLFFLELLTVYEAGFFPCGWEGNWPDGNLIVY